MSWLKKLMPARIRTETGADRKRSVPEGLWEKCDRCGTALYGPELEKNLRVCPKCEKPTREAHKFLKDGKKVRACKKCGETI